MTLTVENTGEILSSIMGFSDVFVKFWKYLHKLRKNCNLANGAETHRADVGQMLPFFTQLKQRRRRVNAPSNKKIFKLILVFKVAKEMQNVVSFKTIFSAVLKITQKREKNSGSRYFSKFLVVG